MNCRTKNCRTSQRSPRREKTADRRLERDEIMTKTEMELRKKMKTGKGREERKRGRQKRKQYKDRVSVIER
jgi:hypothetical protein